QLQLGPGATKSLGLDSPSRHSPTLFPFSGAHRSLLPSCEPASDQSSNVLRENFPASPRSAGCHSLADAWSTSPGSRRSVRNPPPESACDPTQEKKLPRCTNCLEPHLRHRG